MTQSRMVPPPWLNFRRLGYELFLREDSEKDAVSGSSINKSEQIRYNLDWIDGLKTELSSLPKKQDAPEECPKAAPVFCDLGEYKVCELSTNLLQAKAEYHSFPLYICRYTSIFID